MGRGAEAWETWGAAFEGLAVNREDALGVQGPNRRQSEEDAEGTASSWEVTLPQVPEKDSARGSAPAGLFSSQL